MATGKLPFTGPNAMAVLTSLVTETPPPVRTLAPTLPPLLAGMIDRLMSKNPAGRPDSAAEISQLVKELQAKNTAPAADSEIPMFVPTPDSWEDITDAGAGATATKAHEGTKRTRAPWYVAGAVFVLGAVVIAWAMIGQRQTASGTFLVVSDPDADARLKNGRLVLIGAGGKERYTFPASDRNKTIDAGAYRVYLEGASGFTLNPSEFALPNGGQVTVRIVSEPKEAIAKAGPPKKHERLREDPDRKAAEYALFLGGTVRVNDEARDLSSEIQLPSQPFRLTWVNLSGNKSVGIVDLSCFKGVTGPVDLNLDQSGVTDAALASLRGARGLSALFLGGTQVTDAGVANLKGLRGLTRLSLGGTKVTDGVVPHLRSLPDLTGLALCGTEVSDAALLQLRNLTGLTDLDLGRTRVTDSGLAHLHGHPRLESLYLYEMKLTDQALTRLGVLSELRIIYLKGTPVTAQGVADFAKESPKCKVEWNGELVRPKVGREADRRAAEYVLSVGGQVRVNSETRFIKAMSALPTESFQLTEANLARCQGTTDANLALFKECTALRVLDLGLTPTTDAGLVHVRECKGLDTLSLAFTKVSNSGLAHLKDLTELKRLDLGVTSVTDEGLAHFKHWTKLTALLLGMTNVGDTGLGYFRNCKGLVVLNLAGTAITQKGLDLFRDCADMELLELGRTPVTDAGLAGLKPYRELTYLGLGESQITDAGLLHLPQITNLTHLNLVKARVTLKGVTELSNLLLSCKITWDGGTIEPGKEVAVRVTIRAPGK